MERALVCGAGGFIGAHLVSRLTREGCRVRGVDLRAPPFSLSDADEYMIGDLRDPVVCRDVIDQPFDAVYQLAADMGGAGYIFTGAHDAAIMANSVLVNVNVANRCIAAGVQRLFFSSSACVYPAHSQTDPARPCCAEAIAYPAAPDSEYGWEKLFSERLYAAVARNTRLQVRIGRLHNVFGPCGTWQGGREKAPAALCRKVAEADDFTEIEVWGDGQQTRSFLYIDEALEGIRRLMRSSFEGPVNIGSEEMLTIGDLARLVIGISGKTLRIRTVSGPQGVRGRTSDNTLLRTRLGWSPSQPLRVGLAKTYAWIEAQIRAHSDVENARFVPRSAGEPA